MIHRVANASPRLIFPRGAHRTIRYGNGLGGMGREDIKKNINTPCYLFILTTINIKKFTPV